jgi:hypothetical protein
MQDQNFEKQVKQRMEELSLTPSEPVWQKVEEQIRKKRDRRRLLFWLPFTVLSLCGGIWLVTNNIRNTNSIASAKKEKQNNSQNGQNTAQKNDVKVETGTMNAGQNKKTFVVQEKARPSVVTKSLQKQNEIIPEVKPGKQVLQNASVKEISYKKNKAINATNKPLHQENTGNKKQGGDKVKQPGIFPDTLDPVAKKPDEPNENISINKSKPSDSIVNNNPPKENEVKGIDTVGQSKPDLKNEQEDSLAVQKNVAKKEEKPHSKWKLAINAGIARSGINNGLQVFGGGAKSMETTNTLAADRSLNFSQAPSNAGVSYRPPSTQKKSGSFSLGILIKKQIGKRSSLSTGFQYNFYSTEMLVGQNISRDTMADPNKSVNNFYANSGANFSDYHNKFHFVSLPVAFNFQILKNAPLDFHIGLSLQQLVETNALLYSSLSQIYYTDKSAFNKTQLFSELGIEYSFLLGKKLLLKAGPRVNYGHSSVVKESSGLHLFSYGVATEIVFLGK